MILATSNDIDYPHIDWKCSQCGMVYCSAGLPDDNRCLAVVGNMGDVIQFAIQSKEPISDAEFQVKIFPDHFTEL
jgi:hypothetical protein